MNIQQWVPGTFPIPFFQTWCCKNSSVTPSMLFSSRGVDKNDLWSGLKNAGLPPKMYECVSSNLRLNRVGVDCIHYLFHDAECRAFISREFPDDVLYAYDHLIPTAFKADLWRYCVLYKYGGVFLAVVVATSPYARLSIDGFGAETGMGYLFLNAILSVFGLLGDLEFIMRL